MAEWEAFWRLEPRGERRADIRSAQVAQIIYEVNRTKKSRKLDLSDFLLDFEPKKAQTPGQMLELLKGVSDSIGKREKRKPKKKKKPKMDKRKK